MGIYFKQKNVWKIVSFVLLFIPTMLIAQKNSSDEKDQTREEVIIEEKWRGFNWANNIRRTNTYDSADNCISEIQENWNGSRWEKKSWTKSSYDKLHHKVSTLFFKWNSSGKWELSEGSRSNIDTLYNKSTRVVLSDAYWDPSKKIWVATDSIFYDKKGRIIKTVNRDITVSDSLNDTILTIVTIENNFQGDKIWVEQNNTWRSDTKKTVSERYRYRKLNDSPIQLFTIDYWDDKMNRWIPNTAKLFRKVENNQVVLDSIEEIIDDRSVPVFVSSELKDEHGNIMQSRYWQRSIDETSNKWSGTYVKWERNFNADTKKYTIAESVFIADSNGSKWQLMSYQNEICKFPASGGVSESGDFETTFNSWQFERTFDTLTSCGLVINGEHYYDDEKKQWIPMLKFTSINDADSSVITTEVLDLDKGDWNNDSLFVIRTDKSGKIISRTNYVWTRSGMLNGNWSKTNRFTFIPQKN